MIRFGFFTQLLAILIRLPRVDHAAVVAVTSRWRRVVGDGAFVHARARCPLTGASCLEQTTFVLGGSAQTVQVEQVEIDPALSGLSCAAGTYAAGSLVTCAVDIKAADGTSVGDAALTSALVLLLPFHAWLYPRPLDVPYLKSASADGDSASTRFCVKKTAWSR